MSSRIASCVTAAVLAGALITASVAAPVQATESSLKNIDLLYFNDFHGRLDSSPLQFAGAIESERTDQSLVISGGDNIGASEYTSAAQEDNPTLETLNALELDVSAVGNHEFDQGHQDLTQRVRERAHFPYLAANVRVGDAQGPLLMTGEGHNGNGAYELFERNGVTIAVIGAVTASTPERVAPSAVEGLVFTDPVAEVNAVAERLAADGTADVIVATYHDGSATEDQATTDRFWRETSPQVDVVFGGDTHAEYNLTEDTDGDGQPDRAYMQTGSYGANLGTVSLQYDETTDSVDLSSVLRPTSEIVQGRSSEELTTTYPRVKAVDKVVAEASAVAERIGSTPVGKISTDITTAFGPNTDGEIARDNRQAESALGNMIAEGFRAQLAQSHGVDIGVINPGGIRHELYYKNDPTRAIDGESDGVVTASEVNNVLPFANNLNTVELTGAQFAHALEQQWQSEGSERSFLHLGLSENVQYTFDPDRPAGDRITSVTVNGSPIDPNKVYTVASVSFLLSGGDGFTTFTEGKNLKDTGLIDRQVFSQYLGRVSATAPVAAEFDRRAVHLSELSSENGTVRFTLRDLNLSSLGAPHNSTVTIRRGQADGPVIAAATVTDQASGGVATVSFSNHDVAGESVWLNVEPAGTSMLLTDHVLGVEPATSQPSHPETDQPDNPAPIHIIVINMLWAWFGFAWS